MTGDANEMPVRSPRGRRFLLTSIALALLMAIAFSIGKLETRVYHQRSILTDSAAIAAVSSAEGRALRSSIDIERLRNDVAYLASEPLEGRENGSTGWENCPRLAGEPSRSARARSGLRGFLAPGDR